MQEKKKVLFFLNSSVGGGERMTITIAKMLPKEKFIPVFVVVGRQKGEIMNFVPADFDTWFLYVYNMWDFLTLKLIRLLKKERPYAVFSTAMHLNSRLIIAAKKVGGIKIIIRNCNYMSTLRWDKMAMVRLTYHKADWIVSQQDEMTEEIVRALPKVDPSKVVTLHNLLDTETIDKKSQAPNPYPNEDCVNYLWVARFHKTKGQDVLAKAFVEVAKKNDKAHLWFVGKSDGSDNYVAYVKEILMQGGCYDRVHFVGYDANPYRWMKYCDCFVLPSRIEGLPNALIEAQYQGRPCVAATCIPIVERIIDNGVNGYKVPSEDWRAMSDAMLKAPELGKVSMTYMPTSREKFVALFW